MLLGRFCGALLFSAPVEAPATETVTLAFAAAPLAAQFFLLRDDTPEARVVGVMLGPLLGFQLVTLFFVEL